MNCGNKLAIGALVAALAMRVGAGTQYVWTGAQDAYWTNAANWKVGDAVATRCPGVPFTDDYVTAGDSKTWVLSDAGTARKGDTA